MSIDNVWVNQNNQIIKYHKDFIRAILSVPISSASIERMFHAASIISSTRKNINSDTLSSLVSIRYNTLESRRIVSRHVSLLSKLAEKWLYNKDSLEDWIRPANIWDDSDDPNKIDPFD